VLGGNGVFAGREIADFVRASFAAAGCMSLAAGREDSDGGIGHDCSGGIGHLSTQDSGGGLRLRGRGADRHCQNQSGQNED